MKVCLFVSALAAAASLAFEAFGEKVRARYANVAAEAAGKACKVEHRAPLEEAYELSVLPGARPNVGHRALVRFRPGAYGKYRLVVGCLKEGGRPLRSFGLYEEK